MALVRRDVFNELFNDVKRFPEEFQRMFVRNPFGNTTRWVPTGPAMNVWADEQAVYAEVDWSLLTMFAGLFVVVEGIEHTGITARWLAGMPATSRHSLAAFTATTVVMSNLVSNVPAVLVMRGWAAQFMDPQRAWLALAMTSTLAGNLTLVGSVANLVVVEQARGRARVGFWEYARVGVPLSFSATPPGTIHAGWIRFPPSHSMICWPNRRRRTPSRASCG